MRLFAFITLSIVSVFVPFSVFLVFACLYLLKWQGFELLCIGLYLDAQFGGYLGDASYLYTLTIGGLLVGATLLKPYIRFYDEVS